MDTLLAQNALNNYAQHGVIIPSNFLNAQLPGYIRYANDNIDINEETLDGKGTFHASQTAAFRRYIPGEQTENIEIKPTHSRSLNMPDTFHNLTQTNIGTRKPPPVFSEQVQLEWFEPDELEMKKADALD